ncbi:hypothetical protein BD626DRAFT_273469 [Schizophyllum amplum]|uniref:Uncharacterized protein n=1 Tax=Schizophyllum amplum TaxID=97359 RepID=A0A550CFI7_9AGAR|nr:hypothetical protein BD626DRAFT_273469 [Auriculariopsis ampla]
MFVVLNHHHQPRRRHTHRRPGAGISGSVRRRCPPSTRYVVGTSSPYDALTDAPRIYAPPSSPTTTTQDGEHATPRLRQAPKLPPGGQALPLPAPPHARRL